MRHHLALRPFPLSLPSTPHTRPRPLTFRVSSFSLFPFAATQLHKWPRQNPQGLGWGASVHLTPDPGETWEAPPTEAVQTPEAISTCSGLQPSLQGTSGRQGVGFCQGQVQLGQSCLSLGAPSQWLRPSLAPGRRDEGAGTGAQAVPSPAQEWNAACLLPALLVPEFVFRLLCPGLPTGRDAGVVSQTSGGWGPLQA